MRYIDPSTILSPQDAIKEVEVLYENEEDVSIAKIKWNDQFVIGIRWNIAMREWDDPKKINEEVPCLGMPVSRGYPTWFLLPDEMTDPKSEISSILSKITI